MNKRGVWISGVCLLALVGFLSTYAFADGPRLKPKLNYSGEWNDNVHLAGSKDKKASMIYRVYPGLGLQIPLERAYSEFNYQFSYVKKEGDKNVEGHSGNALIRYSLTPRTSLGLSTDYSTDELWDTEDDSYHIWTSKCDIAHKLSSSLSTTFGYTNERYRIPKNNAYADYDDNAGSMGLGIILSPRTSLNLNGGYGTRDFPQGDDKNYNHWDGGVGVSQKLTSRITAGAKVGYSEMEFTQEGVSNASAITYGSDVSVILAPGSTFRVNYNYGLQNTFYARPADVGAVSPFRRNESNVESLDDLYRVIKSQTVETLLTYALTDKDTLSISGAYMQNSAGRDDSIATESQKQDLREETYSGGVSLSHKITRWFSVSANAVYSQRSSGARQSYDYWASWIGLGISF